MPFYQFQIDVNLSLPVVVERLQSIVREKPGFGESFVAAFKPRDPSIPPFTGAVYENSFRIRGYPPRRSFVPVVWGRIETTASGARVFVTIFIHPFDALFATVWLGS